MDFNVTPLPHHVPDPSVVRWSVPLYLLFDLPAGEELSCFVALVVPGAAGAPAPALPLAV